MVCANECGATPNRSHGPPEFVVVKGRVDANNDRFGRVGVHHRSASALNRFIDPVAANHHNPLASFDQLGCGHGRGHDRTSGINTMAGKLGHLFGFGKPGHVGDEQNLRSPVLQLGHRIGGPRDGLVAQPDHSVKIEYPWFVHARRVAVMDTQIVLVRHGETEWSRDHRHTGRTDIGLTANGEREARSVGETLVHWNFVARFTSPLQRAARTAELSGVPGSFTVVDDLMEWDYGVYEGRRTVDIREDEPGWSKWLNPLAEGESVEDVGQRSDRAIEIIAEAATAGPTIVFAHGHLLAILIARWLGLEAADGRRFVLETGTVTVLGVKRDDRVLRLMNHRCGEATISA